MKHWNYIAMFHTNIWTVHGSLISDANYFDVMRDSEELLHNHVLAWRTGGHGKNNRRIINDTFGAVY